MEPSALAAAAVPELALPAGATWLVDGLLAVIMFGIALDLDLGQLRRTLAAPRVLGAGVAAQLLLLPALSVALIALLAPPPAVAVGMLVVACVPGGTVSNVLAHLSDGNTSLSIAMTAASTLLALIFFPLNLAFWGPRTAPAASVFGDVALDPWSLLLGLGGVLVLPVAVGALVRARWPSVARRLVRPFRLLAVGVLVTLVIGSIVANLAGAVDAVRGVLGSVVAHNLLGLTLGYGVATLARAPTADRRAVALEIGVQNAGLALGLTLRFFPADTTAAVVPALYGAWHVLVGLVLARWWSGRPPWRTAS